MRDDARWSRPMLTCLLLHGVPRYGNRGRWETGEPVDPEQPVSLADRDAWTLRAAW